MIKMQGSIQISRHCCQELHTFILSLDAESLVRTFVCRGDSQEAGNAVGGARLLDFFTVSHVRGGAHQDHHSAAGRGLQKQLDTTTFQPGYYIKDIPI